MADDTWVHVDEDHVQGAMNPETRAAYVAWLSMFPDRAERLGELIDQVVNEFRAALRAHPANKLNDDPRSVPQACLRHCETLIISQLSVEMGRTLDDSEVTLAVRAEVFLRQMFVSRWPFAPAEDDSKGWPSYAGREESRAMREVRAI